jgi:hypothetical protein
MAGVVQMMSTWQQRVDHLSVSCHPCKGPACYPGVRVSKRNEARTRVGWRNNNAYPIISRARQTKRKVGVGKESKVEKMEEWRSYDRSEMMNLPFKSVISWKRESTKADFTDSIWRYREICVLKKYFDKASCESRTDADAPWRRPCSWAVGLGKIQKF